MATSHFAAPRSVLPQARPGQDPYSQEGDHIEAGQTLGIIEIMKQFTEVQSEVAGTLSRLR